MADASLSRVVTCFAMVLLLSACASGGYSKNDRPTWDPPARFQGDFPGSLVELPLSQTTVREVCDAMRIKVTSHARGCARRVGDTCVIAYIQTPYGQAGPAAVRRHEIGHCNGWPGDHPD